MLHVIGRAHARGCRRSFEWRSGPLPGGHRAPFPSRSGEHGDRTGRRSGVSDTPSAGALSRPTACKPISGSAVCRGYGAGPQAGAHTSKTRSAQLVEHAPHHGRVNGVARAAACRALTHRWQDADEDGGHGSSNDGTGAVAALRLRARRIWDVGRVRHWGHYLYRHHPANTRTAGFTDGPRAA